jgi:hypothetical protein
VGLAELEAARTAESSTIATKRVRRTGGGRKKVIEQDATLLTDLENLHHDGISGWRTDDFDRYKEKGIGGAYKNNGQEWEKKGEPVAVKVQDFLDPTLGRANPYSVYDLGDDSAWVSVGADYDTAAFAVETIQHWWSSMGRERYPNATELTITTDGGGR